MKANELRLGNLVNHENSDYDQPSEIVKVDLGILEYIQENGDAKEKYLMYHPIPLTEEWLIKFGFEKRFVDEESIRAWVYELKEFKLVGMGFSNSEMSFTFMTRKIKSVHQLQDLYFALTGEELTIK